PARLAPEIAAPASVGPRPLTEAEQASLAAAGGAPHAARIETIPAAAVPAAPLPTSLPSDLPAEPTALRAPAAEAPAWVEPRPQRCTLAPRSEDPAATGPASAAPRPFSATEMAMLAAIGSPPEPTPPTAPPALPPPSMSRQKAWDDPVAAPPPARPAALPVS